MKRLSIVLALCLLSMLLSSRAHAQDLVFSSFQCDPTSCVNELPATVEGSVSGTFDGKCTGGVIGGIHAEATSTVGIDPTTGQPAPCNSPYIPRVEFEVVRTTELNDFCEPFHLDTVRQISEILNPDRSIVFHKELSASCDGGTTGIVDTGTKPC